VFQGFPHGGPEFAHNVAHITGRLTPRWVLSAGASIDVGILDRFGDAATVRLETRWFDYLEVVLIEGEWKVINVLWTGKDGGPLAIEE
jgi:hypothetical protein